MDLDDTESHMLDGFPSMPARRKRRMNDAGAAWLRDQGADAPCYAWAIESCASLREVVETAPQDWMRWTVVRLLDRRGRVEWAWRAASRVRHLMQDERSTAALDTLRRWLDGKATDKELRAAADAAWTAIATYSAAASAAYYAAASAAYYAAADAAARAESAADAADASEVESQRRDALELITAWPEDWIDGEEETRGYPPPR